MADKPNLISSLYIGVNLDYSNNATFKFIKRDPKKRRKTHTQKDLKLKDLKRNVRF